MKKRALYLAIALALVLSAVVRMAGPAMADANSLSMILSVDPSTTTSNGTLYYTVTLINQPISGANSAVVNVTFSPPGPTGAQGAYGTPIVLDTGKLIAVGETVVYNYTGGDGAIARPALGVDLGAIPLNEGVTVVYAQSELYAVFAVSQNERHEVDYVPAQLGQPDVHIEKYVSVDNGVTWLDADSAPGPSAIIGEDLKFMVTICNNGSVPLTNITVSDTDFAFGDVATSLAVGACDNSSIVTVPAVGGQQWDVANVTGQADGALVFDEDPAYYTGLTSGIDIEKYVSVDGGLNWEEADSAPGPSAMVGSDVKFKVQVCNNGSANLTNVVVDDTEFDFTGVATSLLVGACSNSSIVTVPAVAGLHYDLATVTAEADGALLTASDPAYYTGLTPGIDIEKYVSVDGGVTWAPADSPPGPGVLAGKNVSFYVRVCNKGDEPLANISVTDTDFAFTGVAASLAVGACDNSSIVTVPAVAGLHYDLASVTAEADGVRLTASDPAYYTGLTPGVTIEKYVSVDGGITWDPADSAPGPGALVGKNVSFKVTVCNNGSASLTSVVVDDTEFDFTGVATSLLVGACSNSSIVTVAAVAGLHYDLATVTAEADGVPVTASNPAYYTGSAPTPAIEIKKYTNGEDADEAPGPYIAIGNAVTWTYVVRNTGNVDLTSVSVTDDKLGVIDTISLLPVGATETRYRYGTAAAAQYANNATVIGHYGAAEVTDWDPSHYYGRPAAVGWETYPVNKVRVLLPWIGLLGVMILGASLLVLRHCRVRS